MEHPNYSFRLHANFRGFTSAQRPNGPPIPPLVYLWDPLVSLSSIFLPCCLHLPSDLPIASCPLPPTSPPGAPSVVVLCLDPSPYARRHWCARPRARSRAILLSVHVPTPNVIGACVHVLAPGVRILTAAPTSPRPSCVPAHVSLITRVMDWREHFLTYMCWFGMSITVTKFLFLFLSKLLYVMFGPATQTAQASFCSAWLWWFHLVEMF
jgi:hypothetical protein